MQADYLKSLTLKNLPLDCYLFGVFTCGKSCGFAEETLSAVISEKGLKLSAAYMIPMPDNYIPMFPLISKEEQNKMLSEAEPLLDGAISNIKSRNKATINSQKPPKPVAYLIRKVFIPKQQKARDNYAPLPAAGNSIRQKNAKHRQIFLLTSAIVNDMVEMGFNLFYQGGIVLCK